MRKQTFYIATLGCKVNQYESHALREAWLADGWSESPSPEAAERILINSCAVTAKAVADVRGAVRRLHRAAPEAEMLITGCAARLLADELKQMPGVRAVVPQEYKANLLRMAQGGQTPGGEPPGCEAPSPAAPAFPPFALSGYNRSRAVLKVQDGCSHGCAYCIVPLTRGKSRTRPFADALAEARRLLAGGFREIVVSGVNLRQYRDDGKRNFWAFLKALEESLAPDWAGRARLRISSLEPGQLTNEGLEVLAASRLTAPHLHLSLQSGSPAVLQRMGRGHYSLAGIHDFLNELKRRWPVFGLGADILTGFPGETDKEFMEGLEFCRGLPLSYAHVFPYSRRPGTAAASLPGQLPNEAKKERAALLRKLVAEKKSRFLGSLLELPDMQVIFESGGRESGPPYQGVNEYYADCLLHVGEGDQTPPFGQLTPVKAIGSDGERLLTRVAAVKA